MAEKEIKKEEKMEKLVLDLRRVARVVAGGKRFKFRATLVVGNRNGKVGVGIGKGLDVAEAIDKAERDAEKKLFTIPLRENRTIPHEVEAKYSAARVRIKPARAGHGLIAGGAARVVLELGGVKDISCKILSHTKNKLTTALATVKALKKLKG